MGDSGGCGHLRVVLLNPWELLRKWVCEDCRAVMTCACSSDVAVHVLPHQAMRGVDPETRGRVAVTLPLEAGVCAECRGGPWPAWPKSPRRGAGSVIHRYYWHELWTRTQAGLLAWCREQGLPLLDNDGSPLLPRHARDHPGTVEAIEQDVLAGLRGEHDHAPRYAVERPSDANVLAAHRVEVEAVPAVYVDPSPGKALVVAPGTMDPAHAVGVEEYVAALEHDRGRATMFLESRPVQCLWGALMWPWVQHPADDRLMPNGFGGRDGVDADERGMIWTLLPEDFGSPGHARRRADALDEHLAWLPDDTAGLLAVYDMSLDPSRALRQYLWAYTPDEESRGRTLVRVLGAARVKTVLRALAVDYWDRYLGWPDLLAWEEAPDGPAGAGLIEVKSSGDRLSDDQRRWIALNDDVLGLPFRIVKVHRKGRLAA